jgi:hypothetical protein
LLGHNKWTTHQGCPPEAKWHLVGTQGLHLGYDEVGEWERQGSGMRVSPRGI